MSNRAHQLRQVESVIFLCVPISQCKALLDTSFGQHRFENYSWWNCLFWIYWIFKWIVNPTFIKMDLFLSGWRPTQVLKDVVRTGKENRGINYNNREMHWPLKIRIKKGIAGMVIWPPPPHCFFVSYFADLSNIVKYLITNHWLFFFNDTSVKYNLNNPANFCWMC